jgi:hypothetical protein
MTMVSPFVPPPFSLNRSEDAVAFAKAGNAALNKHRRAVNTNEQAIKMPCFAFIERGALNRLLSKEACLSSFCLHRRLKMTKEEA